MHAPAQAQDAKRPDGICLAGGKLRRLGRERLHPSEEVFFPWSIKPLPSFARQFAGQALKKAGSLGRLKGRRLPFLKDGSESPASPPTAEASTAAYPSGMMDLDQRSVLVPAVPSNTSQVNTEQGPGETQMSAADAATAMASEQAVM